MVGYQEYNNSTVSGNGCSYATLDAYNQNFSVRGRMSAPRFSQTGSSEVIIVPSFGANGYNTLTQSAAPSCSGYFDIRNAYPNYPNTCGKFSSNLCG